MKPYILKEINEESFLEISEQCRQGLQEVYINTRGGSIMYEQLIRQTLERFNVKLYVLYNIISSGFNLFYYYKGDKYLIPGCYGLVHQPSLDIETKKIGLVGEDKIQFDSMNQSMPSLEYPFLTSKERKRYDAGEDIWFDYERMKNIFKGVPVVEKI